MKNSVLGTYRPEIEFSVLVDGVDYVSLVKDRVSGTWTGHRLPFIDKRWPPLCQHFANWADTPEAILNFTRKYGPLRLEPRYAKDDKGCAFSFSVEEWRKDQRDLRQEWFEKSAPLPKGIGAGRVISHRSVEPMGPLTFEPGKLIFTFETLLGLMQVEMALWPREYMKVCRICQTCFIETDSRVKYCGRIKCRLQARNESNKLGWHRNKARWTSKH